MGQKKWVTALILSVLLGVFGLDRFYLGYTLLGSLKLVTAGGLGFWWLADIVLIATGIMKDADGQELAR